MTGENSAECLVFVVAERSWFRLQNMCMTCSCHGSICIKGVLLLVFGGYQGAEKS